LKSFFLKLRNLICPGLKSDSFSELSPFFNVSLDLLCITDLSGKILKINKTWAEVLNYYDKDIKNNFIWDYVHKEDFDKTFQAIEGLKKEGKLFNLINRYKTKNGDYKHLEWRAFVYENRIYVSARDISQEIEAEKKLRYSENKLRLIFNNSPFGIIHYNSNGIITEVNDSFAAIIGSDKSVLNGLNMFALDDKQLTDALKISIEKKKTVKVELTYKAKTSNRVFPARVLFVPVKSSDYDLDGGVGIVEDITERSEFESKIKESMEKYIFLFEQAADGVLIGNEQGEIIDANASICNMSGYTKEELLGNKISILFDKKTLENTPLDYDAVLRGETVLTSRKLTKKDGSLIFIEMNTKKVGDGRLQTYIRDITDRISAQEQIRKSEEDLRITLNSIGDAVIATDINSRITRMNPVAAELTGWEVKEAEGRHLEEVFYIRDHQNSERNENPVNTVLATGEVVDLENSTVLVSRNGALYHISDSAAPIRDSDNNIVGSVLVFRDVTEQYVLKERLRHSEKMEAIGQLTGGIAHDYNNMLSGIFGGVELLEKAKDNTEAKKYIDLIKVSAQRTSELTKKLLSFGRKSDLVFTNINLNEAVENTIEILKYTLDKKIEISFVKELEDLTVSGSLSQLQNVFMNLGINSGFALKNGGSLTFTTKTVFLDKEYCSGFPDAEPGVYALTEVTDTGEGIPEKYQSKVFEPFFTTRHHGEGSGLGLAGAYSIIQEHGGIITFYSEENKGTTFHIYLPVAEEKCSIEHCPEKEDILKGSGVILLVEDEDVVRETVASMLKELGYTVYTAENGKIGADEYKKHSDEIDLVILDMIMPEMNGKDCFYAIKEFDENAKIILSSGFSREEDVFELKENGLKAFIKKPFYISELNKVIHSII